MTATLVNGYQLILCTCPTTEVAKKIARYLVESNLAACVNILPEITSIYRWEDKTEIQPEILLLIKSAKHVYPQLEAAIIELHPYDTPEIIAIPIQEGHPKYLQWLDSTLLTHT